MSDNLHCLPMINAAAAGGLRNAKKNCFSKTKPITLVVGARVGRLVGGASATVGVSTSFLRTYMMVRLEVTSPFLTKQCPAQKLSRICNYDILYNIRVHGPFALVLTFKEK